jgi:hypothetical protein
MPFSDLQLFKPRGKELLALPDSRARVLEQGFGPLAQHLAGEDLAKAVELRPFEMKKLEPSQRVAERPEPARFD